MNNIFISHSSRDKPFVRKLDSALVANGFNVFLDERVIKVGDSIPSAIYKGISESNFIVYVISQNALDSNWVQEELDIAKMKQKAEAGFKILPVLIEDIALPTSMRHVRYCKLTNWTDASCFAEGLNELLVATELKLTDEFIVINNEIHVLLDDHTGHYSRLERRFRIRSLKDGLDIYPTVVGTDGRIENIEFSPGHIVRSKKRGTDPAFHAKLTRPLGKGEELDCELKCQLRDAFLDPTEYWKVKNNHPTERFSLTVHFDPRRKYKTYTAIQSIGHHELDVSKQPGEMVLKGRPCLFWEVIQPVRSHSYVLEWNW